MTTRFDPQLHVRRLDDGTPYLDVKWRLHWLRSEYPDAEIDTQILSLEDELIVCRASVRIPDGGSATGHGSAARNASNSQIELAETRAIGRALAALGFGAEFTVDDVLPSRPAERPVTLVPQKPQPEPAPAPRMRPVRDESEPGRPVSPAPSRPVREPVMVPDARAEADESAPPADDGATMLPTPLGRGSDLRARQSSREDVSWSAFWEWAKPRGYRDAAHLRELLGIDIQALTPGEVRNHIRRYELDHPPGSDN